MDRSAGVELALWCLGAVDGGRDAFLSGDVLGRFVAGSLDCCVSVLERRPIGAEGLTTLKG